MPDKARGSGNYASPCMTNSAQHDVVGPVSQHLLDGITR